MSMESVNRSASQWLREARQSEGWELDLVSQQTKIPVDFLKAIEEGDWDRLPGAVYARAFVRTLAGLYGLDQDEIVRLLRSELNIVPMDTALPSEVITDFTPETESEQVVPTRKPVGLWIAIGVIALLFAGTILFTRLPEHTTPPPSVPVADTVQDSTVDSVATVAEKTTPPVVAGASLRLQDTSEVVTVLYLRNEMVHKKTFQGAHDSLQIPRDTTMLFRNLSGKCLKFAGSNPKDSVAWKFFEAGSKGDSFWVRSVEDAEWFRRYNAVMARWHGHRKGDKE